MREPSSAQQSLVATAGMTNRSFGLGLLAVALIFLALAAARSTPEALFGANHDDSLYFTTAKALAAGDGLVMPSVPGVPPQTKYPVLYPLLLSAVWLVEPEFPANLDWAWALTLAFGAAGAVIFGILARQLGAGPREALLLTALAVWNPFYVYWSNVLVSDIVFLAFAAGAVTLACRALERHAAGTSWAPQWAGVVCLLWLACATRTLGVAFVAGIAAYALWRGPFGRGSLGRSGWLAAAGALSAVLPIALKLAGFFGRASLPASADTWDGFRDNLLYYTSYLEFWRLSAPTWDVVAAQVAFTFGELLKHPANSLLLLGAEGIAAMWLQLLAITLSAGIYAGTVRRARRVGLHPVHLAAVFYLPIVLLWNYPLLTRFGLPFSLLLLAGASEQVQAIVEQLRKSWREGPLGDRVIGSAFVAGLAALLGLSAYRLVWETPRLLGGLGRTRAELTEPKREAYDWIARNTAPDAVFISYEDASLYLYADRLSMRPASMTTDSFFMQDMDRFNAGLAKLADTALALDADYWFVSPDNFGLGNDPERTRARVTELLKGLPVVFTSRDGRVRVVALEGERWSRVRERRLAREAIFAQSPKPMSDSRR